MLSAVKTRAENRRVRDDRADQSNAVSTVGLDPREARSYSVRVEGLSNGAVR
jgi:hypothetical protein